MVLLVPIDQISLMVIFDERTPCAGLVVFSIEVPNADDLRIGGVLDELLDGLDAAHFVFPFCVFVVSSGGLGSKVVAKVAVLAEKVRTLVVLRRLAQRHVLGQAYDRHMEVLSAIGVRLHAIVTLKYKAHLYQLLHRLHNQVLARVGVAEGIDLLPERLGKLVELAPQVTPGGLQPALIIVVSLAGRHAFPVHCLSIVLHLLPGGVEGLKESLLLVSGHGRVVRVRLHSSRLLCPRGL